MDQTAAIIVLICIALVAANLPFASQRFFLLLPWQVAENRQPWQVRLGDFAVYVALLAGWFWLPHVLIAQGVVDSGLMQALRLAGVAVGALVVLMYPGWRGYTAVTAKPLVVRLLEVLLFYFMVGAVGFAFEASVSNPFAKGWEFYAITLSLFLVMAYPGFVYRYLLRHPRKVVAHS